MRKDENENWENCPPVIIGQTCQQCGESEYSPYDENRIDCPFCGAELVVGLGYCGCINH